jgi:hypothetical protein
MGDALPGNELPRDHSDPQTRLTDLHLLSPSVGLYDGQQHATHVHEVRHAEERQLQETVQPDQQHTAHNKLKKNVVGKLSGQAISLVYYIFMYQ